MFIAFSRLLDERGFKRLNVNNRGNALGYLAIEARGLRRLGSLEI